MDSEPENPPLKGRPKGSKNKPKRGRPKKIKEPVSKVKKIKPPKISKSKLVSSDFDEEHSILLDSHLDDAKFTDVGYNTCTDKIINEEPIDPSYYYRGSKHVPVAGAEYEYTGDMVEELRKCKEDIIYFAENFFFIVALDRGKEKIELYEAQKRVLRSFVADRNVIVCSSRQIGKALGLDTPIRTTKGWSTMRDIKVGDLVFGSSGDQTTVTHVHDVMDNRPCYKVTTDSGEVIIADESHEWFTQHRTERQKAIAGSVKTTKQIFDTLKCSGSTEPAHRIPMSLDGVQQETVELPIDPYVLGLWLGDGSKEAGWVIVGDRDIDHISTKLRTNTQFDKITTRRYAYTTATYITITSSITPHSNSLHALLKASGLYKNKHIPEEYFTASRDQRLELLRGLMDSDGYVAKNGTAVFYSSDQTLYEDVFRLITELGYKTSTSSRLGRLNGVAKKMCYGVNFKPREAVVTIPFKLDRIKLQENTHDLLKRAQYHYIVDISPCGSVPVRCITVDAPDSLYLAGRTLIPTHNSTMLTVFSLWMVCFHDDYRAAIVANKETTAINIFKRIRMAYEQLPNYIKPGVKDYGKTGMTLGNDSSIVVSTTTATSIRGDSLNCVVGDSYIDVLDTCGMQINICIKHLCFEEITLNAKNYKILTKNGWSNFRGIKRSSTNKKIYTVETVNFNLKCTEDHLIFIDENNTKQVKDLRVGSSILCSNGLEEITRITGHGYTTEYVYDVLETEDHSFLANGINVHNCVLLDEAAHIECLHGNSTVNIKNKHTNEIRTVLIKELNQLLKLNQKV